MVIEALPALVLLTLCEPSALGKGGYHYAMVDNYPYFRWRLDHHSGRMSTASLVGSFNHSWSTAY